MSYSDRSPPPAVFIISLNRQRGVEFLPNGGCAMAITDPADLNCELSQRFDSAQRL